jgi:hypothetical protein
LRSDGVAFKLWPSNRGRAMMRSLLWHRPLRRDIHLFVWLIPAITATFATSASASDLVVTCRMTQTDQDGSQYSFQRHYEIVFEVTHADIYDDHGSGWRRVYTGNFVKADNSRILITQTANEYHEISRTTGDVYDKISNGSVYRGSCDKAEPLRQKF